MKAIEALQSGAAWKAAITGSFPTDLSSLAGITTTLPAKMGQELIDYASNGLQILGDLSGSPDSIIGAVVAAIKSIVSALKKGAAQRELNYATARVGYLAEARGVRLASKLTGYQGCPGGFWNYPRAGIAKDHCVPIWDPLGTPGNLPAWMVPYGWAKGPPNPWWPDGSKSPVGNGLPDVCYDWEDINFDTGDSDCSVDANKIVIVAWPWAWPLSCPLRAAGSFLRFSKGPESVVAAQYMLPTPQHVLTRMSDVAESKRIITAALKWWWPKAYEAAPGTWLNNGGPRQTQGYDPKNPGSGTTFDNYALALSRIHGFERCRAAMLADRDLVPEDVRALYKENPDFSASPDTGPIVVVGSLNGKFGAAPVAGGELGGVLVLGGLALALGYALTR